MIICHCHNISDYDVNAAIDWMWGSADGTIARILFLDGYRNLQIRDPLRICGSPKETLDTEPAPGHGALDTSIEAGLHCAEVGYFVEILRHPQAKRCEAQHV